MQSIYLYRTTALNPLCPPILLTFKTLSVIETSFFLRFTFPLFALNTRSVVEIFYFKSKNGTNLNSKDLYRHIRSLTSPKVSIPKELIDSSGTTVSGVLNIANLYASRFASHFTLDDGFLPTIPSHPLTPFLCNVSFLPHEVHKALKQLSPSCSKGHDNIPQIVFRKCSSPIPQFSINNVPLVTVPQQRDLGVQVIPSLLNRASIEDRVKKATTVMNIMLRSVSRLSYLGLPALFERRVIYDLVLARRIMNGDTLLDRNRFFTFTPLRCRTNNFGIYIEHTKSTPRYHCFSRRVSRIYNALPSHIHLSPSITVFKKRLSKLEFDFSKYIFR
ncbi:hypothetical protein PRIPAC_84066 [Pristionchus pacificus]|uniref:Uncharacterized protein n=1 Tax=Pristionchus pacificus TaxID=54126 RepID=A0A2A6BT15_PRIPA|nr:hypothetical protein PRIPAC_84066 [Pristionchus pacificus]|eukprot:PDM69028.1 hypothetical protein PRIPAC_47330 [Pristionchus pacificus]